MVQQRAPIQPDSATLEERVRALIDLLTHGRTREAIERYYAPSVVVFENRELARMGRQECLDMEAEAIRKGLAPHAFRVTRFAVNEEESIAFVEAVVRLTSVDGRPMRLEQVSVQEWQGGSIVSERLYYEGLVDEGDESD